MTQFSKLEEEAIELIREEGEILQKDLWKELDCSSGKGSEIARKLSEAGIVNRERKTVNGSSTYVLQATRKDAEDLDFSLLLAGDMLPPFIDDDGMSSMDDRFTQWILNLQEEYDIDD